VPGYLDRRLVRDAIEGQCSSEPKSKREQTNLFEPVPGDHGAHGDFDDRAREHDAITRAAAWLGAAGVRAIAVGVAMGAVAVATTLIRFRR
jgi:hypothetical protein